MKLLIFLLAVWNVVTFIMMGVDKRKATHDQRRISEKTLLGSAFAMGSIGEIAGAFVFHHKTRKLKFQVLLPLALIFNAAVVYGLYYLNLI